MHNINMHINSRKSPKSPRTADRPAIYISLTAAPSHVLKRRHTFYGHLFSYDVSGKQ